MSHSSDFSLLIKLMHSWHPTHQYPYQLTRGPVLKLTMLHCSSGNVNDLIEIADP